MKYAVVIEKAGKSYSAYVPDLPGCVATGRTPAEVSRRIRSAVAMHIDGMVADGVKPPKPTARMTWASSKPPARRSRAA